MAANTTEPVLEDGGGRGVKHGEVEEKAAASPAQASATMLHRSGSRPQLDLIGSAIHGTLEDRNPTILLPNQSDDISHLALDIGEFEYQDQPGELRGSSSATPVAVKFDCSRSNPCSGISLHDVKLTYQSQVAESSCRNAQGSAIGLVVPPSCL